MIDRNALVAHHKSKKHKQRVKQLKDAPWSQKGFGLIIFHQGSLVLVKGPVRIPMSSAGLVQLIVTNKRPIINQF